MIEQAESLGRVDLVRVLKKETLRAVAETCGVHYTAVHQWATGRTRPKDVYQAILFRRYGVRKDWLTRDEREEVRKS